ncbi:MAG: hypothetical protein WCT24_00655 [Patescibacteria group bacterium]
MSLPLSEMFPTEFDVDKTYFKFTVIARLVMPEQIVTYYRGGLRDEEKFIYVAERDNNHEIVFVMKIGETSWYFGNKIQALIDLAIQTMEKRRTEVLTEERSLCSALLKLRPPAFATDPIPFGPLGNAGM